MALERQVIRLPDRWANGAPIPLLLLAVSCWISGDNSAVIAFQTPLKLRSPAMSRVSKSHRLRMDSNSLSAVQQQVAVSIDQPLVEFERMSPVTKPQSPGFNIDWPAIKKTIMGILASKNFQTALKTAAVGVCLFLAYYFLSKYIKARKTDPSSSTETTDADSIIDADGNTGNDNTTTTKEQLSKLLASTSSTLSALALYTKGKALRLRDRFRKQPEEVGVPMPFDYHNDNEGWGVCTLRSKRRLGRSSFVQYEFDLPEADYVLPLDLGQQVSLCCLDNDNNVAKGDFFPYNAGSKPRLGTFSILAPNRTPPENEFAIGDDAANFVRVLKQDLKVGDEVALKPGKNRLEYRGQYLPVTDMVYIACGTGVVPVMDQVRMVLPSTSSSSVESVTVVWINESARDFDVTAEQLEKEYHKYNTKLAVSCIVDDLTKGETAMSNNPEIYEAVPDFIPGTMAVLSGPVPIMKRAVEYLRSRGYPLDCMCML